MANSLVLDALGTRWFLEFSEPSVKEQLLIKKIRRFERDYSRFVEDSLISRLNSDKILKKPPNELQDMLNYCLGMYCQTDGVFNITVGSLLEKLGYGRWHDQTSKISQNLADDVIVEADQIVIAKHVRIDLGGIGKGWLIDDLGGAMQAYGCENYIINGGGDILCGSLPQKIFIEHPTNKSQVVGEVMLAREAMASSSCKKRVWRDGKDNVYSHIVAPGAFASVQADLLSIHVRAPEAKLADVVATVLLLVDHKKRIKLANLLNVQFLEIHNDLTFWQTSKFGFKAYS